MSENAIDAATVRHILDMAVKFDEQAHWDDFMETCERCKGRGYHHGFGEDGHDPDWCIDCGGPGCALNNERIEAARAEWIAAQLRSELP